MPRPILLRDDDHQAQIMAELAAEYGYCDDCDTNDAVATFNAQHRVVVVTCQKCGALIIELDEPEEALDPRYCG